MSDRTGDSLKIDQMLHGYDDGHRLLAQSRNLDGHNKHIVQLLSDRSTDARDISESGYLTGYPLPSENVYVLARTWPAPEMKRPGCVWTHSLIVSFTDLAQIEDTSLLTRLFRKPLSKKELSKYRHARSFDPHLDRGANEVDLGLAERLLFNLYARPNESVAIDSESTSGLEETIFAIWSQQWPRLRRNFMFCTQTSRDRSTSQFKFDLQIMPRSALQSLNWKPYKEFGRDVNFVPGHWVSTCLQDLQQSVHPLRDFLRRAAGDITGGRDRFAELCELYNYLNSPDETSSIENTLDYVTNRLPDGEGQLLRKQVLSMAVDKIGSLSDRSLMVVLPHLQSGMSFVDEPDRRRLAFRYWEIDPSILLNETTPSELRHEFDVVVSSLSSEDAFRAMVRNPKLFDRVLSTRSDVVVLPEFWDEERCIVDAGQILSNLDKRQKKAAILAIISAKKVNLSEIVVEACGPKFVFETVLSGKVTNTGSRFILESLKASENAKRLIESYLIKLPTQLTKSVLHAFIEHVGHGELKNVIDKDLDIWASAWDKSSGKLPAHELDEVYVYFFKRALAIGGTQGTSLLLIVFDPLKQRIADHELSYDQRWELSNYLLPADWFDWTYAGRFMRTVADYIVKNYVSEEYFGKLSKEPESIKQLAYLMESSWQGRQYLQGFAERSTRH